MTSEVQLALQLDNANGVSDEILQAERLTEQAWEPRKAGPCCKNVCNYYFCCVNANGSKIQDGCCGPDHISMHMFFLGMVVSLFLIAWGVNSDNSASYRVAYFPYYVLGIGWGIFLIAWSVFTLKKILKGRMDSAEIIDKNAQFKAERGNLFVNIQNAQRAELRLKKTQKTTQETTELLKEKYKKIKKWTDQTDIVSGQNSKIASQIKRKFGRMIGKLREELIMSEMGMIEALFDEIHFDDGMEGLTKDEYERFLKQMPEEYREKFKFRMSDFSQIAGDDDVIQKEELMKVLEAVVDRELEKDF